MVKTIILVTFLAGNGKSLKIYVLKKAVLVRIANNFSEYPNCIN